ncbi:hypothetical protein D3C81_1220260 [compost metagenome]
MLLSWDVDDQRDVESADPLVVSDPQLLADFLRGNVFLLEAEVISVKYQHRVLPQTRFFQPFDQLPNCVIGIVGRLDVIPEHRVFHVRRKIEMAAVLRHHKRIMTRSGDKLGVKRLVLRCQLRQLFHANPVHFLVRGSKIVKMIVRIIRLVIILIEVQRRVHFMAVPKSHFIDVERVCRVPATLQQARKAWDLPIAVTGRHRFCGRRINRRIGHKLGIRRIAGSDLLKHVREVEAFLR